MSQPLDAEPGSELFASYEADFRLAYAEITQKIDQVPELGAEPRKAAIRAAERAIDEADEIVGQMAIELQNISSGSRAKLNTRLRGYRADLDKVKRELRKASEQADRTELFGARAAQSGGSGISTDDISQDQRQQLLSGTERLENSSQRLRDSQRLANETEAIGAGILTDLRGQREQIVNSRNVLMEADTYVDKSIRTLRGMARRMVTNRLITIGIVVLLIIIIAAILLGRFLPRRR
ncbi:vesicle transport v-SNARE protein N-terminus-domain-containing protein [Lipomyces kononenkoae]|uniref:Vesicle transport v-SNARE protein N-terminus-domain-containing protein n=1 Tax=Lipomyces kononenkoae TaxID=34357 RepID=A0ACC3T9M5_LIPKO